MTPRLALALALLLPASAPARTMQQRLEQTCAPQIDRLCAAARPDPDRIDACLAAHRDDLPPACASLVDSAD